MALFRHVCETDNINPRRNQRADPSIRGCGYSRSALPAFDCDMSRQVGGQHNPQAHLLR
jgi:hypothetical protein